MSKQSLFRFKKFNIDHSRVTMKVGTDGVLLGAWLNVNNATRILDIGTGSGVIALMMAQRTDESARIDAVEIENQDAEQAVENVRNSPWPEKVKVHCMPVQNFNPTIQYDLIVSNPPFFLNSYQPPDSRRTQSRHTKVLTHGELADTVTRLIDRNGTFNVILPPVEGQQFIDTARERELYLTRKFLFKTREQKPPERWLLEFAVKPGTICEGVVLLYEKDETWTDDYKSLTSEFYLKA
jgi:tRNA1Val (adenine37-N6)-methyltransferase